MSATHTKQAEIAKGIHVTDEARVPFRNILFATDFSASANLALPYAAGFARSLGATLHVIHVPEPINYALPPEIWLGEEKAREAELQRLQDSLRREYPELHPNILAAEGMVWTAVENAVRRSQIDLVVIGTRGRTGPAKFLLGSEAESILRHVVCPVLTVGPQVTSEQRRQGRIRSILFATDFGPSSLVASRYAISLAEEYETSLAFLHVVAQPESQVAETPEAVEQCVKVLQQLFPPAAQAWCQPSFIAAYGQPAEKILELAEKRDADLIVMGVHAPEGFPGAATHFSSSTVHQIITHAPCAVLTVPAKSVCCNKLGCSQKNLV